MTRETKVGLLIGLGLILLVGIIASDALSVRKDAQQQDTAPLTQFADQAQKGIAPTPAPMRSAPPTASSALPPSVPASTPPVPVTPEPTHRVQLVPGGQPEAPSSIPPPLQSVQAPEVLVDSSLPAPPTTWRLGNTDRTGASLSQPSNLPAGVTVVEPPMASTTGANPAHVTDAADGPAPSLPGAEQIYMVAEGDTLKTIAARYYSDSDYWRSLAEVNADIVRADGSVRPGDRLRLPNRSGLVATGLFEQVDSTRPDGTRTSATLVLNREADATTREAPPRGTPTLASNAPKASDKTVEVKAGDSLAKLAERHLGSQGEWNDLYEANRDQLDSPDRVVVGMKLRLPSSEAGASQADAVTFASNKEPAVEATLSKPATASTSAGNASGGKTSGGKTYTVKAGDSLIRIAERELGSSDRWEELFKANQEKLSSPDAIKVGQELKLPS
jgi:nucleoid-associated protein YgaU